MSVSSHVQRGLDFAQYRTYDWSQADALPAGDPRLDGNPFFRDHLAGAIEKQLALKGLERSTAGAADLLVHYHANISRRLDVNRLDREFGYCYDASCRARVFDYEAGTLVVDIVDTRTHLLIWRGWARHGVDDVLGNEDRMARTVNEAVRRMLARFPRSVEGGE
jgi:hypothetical protein